MGDIAEAMSPGTPKTIHQETGAVPRERDPQNSNQHQMQAMKHQIRPQTWNQQWKWSPFLEPHTQKPEGDLHVETLKTGYLSPCPLGWSTQTKNRVLGSDFIFLCALRSLVLLKYFGNFPLALLNHRPAFILREDHSNLLRASAALSPHRKINHPDGRVPSETPSNRS